MIHKKTAIYKEVLENREIFPEGIYYLQQIYDLIFKFASIPVDHLKNRSDVSYPLWKNYIHSVRPSVKRIEFLGNQMYRFKK